MKVTGSNIAITDSVINKMQILPLGNCEQDGTPTPDNPIDVKVVTGDNQLLVQNKNILDISSINETYYGANFDGRDGTLKINGTYVGATYLKIATNVYLKAGQTKASVNLISGTAKYNDEIDVNLGLVAYYNGSYRVVNNITNDGLYDIYISNGYSSGTVFTDAVYELQIEYNTQSSSFVKHAEQSTTLHLGDIKLYGIGDYIDLPFKDGDTWKIRRKVGKISLGNYNWVYSEGVFKISQDEYKNRSSLGKRLFSNIFINSNDSFENMPDNSLKNQTYSAYNICAKCSSANGDATTFKNLCIEKNAIAYLVYTTPTEETITDTTLINDLNNLQELLSYDGTTNITVTSEDTNAQMEVEVTYTSESDMNEKLTYIFDRIKSKLYHIIRAL